MLSVEANGQRRWRATSTAAARTYHTPAGPGEVLAPNGSSNGRNALKASVQNGDGCIDIARSSGPPRAIGTDLATFEYYTYALDALGWATDSSKAPSNLTLTQLRSIYNCTFTNWNQVGGSAGVIERYMPQSGSGTYQFFRDDVLGFDPASFSGPSCPAIQFAQENSGQQISVNGDQQSGIHAVLGRATGSRWPTARSPISGPARRSATSNGTEHRVHRVGRQRPAGDAGGDG